MYKFFVGIMVAITMATLGACTRVDPGYEGVVINMYGSSRGVDNIPIVTGRVNYNPFTEDVYTYPVFKQTHKFEEFQVNSSDGTMFKVDPAITINVIPGKTPFVYKTYRKDFDEVVAGPIQQTIQGAYRKVMNEFTTDDILTKRQHFEAELYKELNVTLTAQGFQISQMTSGLNPPQAIVNSIIAKNAAIQEAQLVDNQLVVAKAQAEKKIIEAEADAKANELRQRTLTPLLIQQEFVQKWDGHAPLYGSAPTMFKNVN